MYLLASSQDKNIKTKLNMVKRITERAKRAELAEKKGVDV